jgi:gas vesicle protein
MNWLEKEIRRAMLIGMLIGFIIGVVWATLVVA